MTGDEILDALCAHTVELEYDDVDAETVEAAKLRIFDSLVCASMALPYPEVAGLMEYASTKRGASNATVFGTDEAASVEYAAFANSAAIRFLDWNDTYLSTEAAHPSGNLGAVLALGEAYESSGRDVLLATVLAYDIHCRLCDVASFNPNGFDHVNFGLVSVPLAVGRLMGMTESELKQAVNIALAGHIALLQSRRSTLTEWKGFAFGNAVRNGVVAAELAQGGIRGPSEIFTGEFGVNTILDPEIDVDALQFGDGFAINETHLKRYPVCYLILSAVDCVMELRDALPVPVDEIEEVTVETYDRAEIVTASPGTWRPTTRATADHSTPYCVARALLDGKLGPDELDENRLAEEDVEALMDRVRVVHEPSFSQTYGETFTQSVSIAAGGERYDQRVDHPSGHVENPLSLEDVVGKLVAYSDCSEGAVRDLSDAVDGLDDAPDIARVTDAMSVIGTELRGG